MATVLFGVLTVGMLLSSLGSIAIGIAVSVLQGVAGPSAIGRTVAALSRQQ